MIAVVLAAGRGTRLAPLTNDRPKPLMEVGGRPLLLRTIQRCMQVGIPDKDVVIVTGYREDRIEEVMRREGLRCRLVFNARWFEWNNFYSLLVAREAVGKGPFLQIDGDVAFDERVMPKLLAAKGPVAVAVELKPDCDAEAMKVNLGPDGRIVAVSKTVPPAGAAGEFVGLTRIDAEMTPVLFDDLERFEGEGLTHEYYDHSYHRLASSGLGPFWPCDVSDCDAIEIDDPQDLARADAMFARR